MNEIVSIEEIRGAIRESYSDGGSGDDAESAISKLESYIFNHDYYDYAECK